MSAASRLLAALALTTAAGCVAEPVNVPVPDLGESEDVVADAVRAAVAKVESDPDALDAWVALGDRLRAHGWDAEAARAYGRAESLAPGEFLWPYLRGLSIGDTDLAGSAEALSRAVRLDPDYPPARVHYGRALLKLGRADDAREQFAAASKADPANAHAWLGLGQCAMAAGAWGAARVPLERAVALGPGLGEAHHLLAQTYLALGRERDATAHAEAARTLPKETSMPDPRAHRPVVAVGSRANNDRGILLVREGRDAEAERHFREALRINPEYAEAHYNLGTVLARARRTDEAIAHLRDAIRLGPGHADSHVNLGIALRSTGRQDEALEQFREALRLDPAHGMARVHMGDSLAAQGALSEALSHYREAARTSPDWPVPARKLAWVLATHPDGSVRDGARAVDFAESACRATGFRDPESLDALAAAYAEVGRFGDAVVAARKAESLMSDPERSEHIRKRIALYEARRPYRD